MLVKLSIKVSPRLYDKDIDPQDFYPNYLQTYVERDVRLLQNIQDLNVFIRFGKLCAGRLGQLLNLSSLANDTKDGMLLGWDELKLIP